MSLRKFVITASLVVVASAAAPSKASADWLLTPFIGATFGGNANLPDQGLSVQNEFERRLSYGASIAWMGAGIFGFEADFGYSPNFFRSDDNGNKINFVGDGNETTLMANVVLGAPLGGVRPYVSGGVGIMKSSVDNLDQFFDKPTSSDLGYDVGAGVMGFFSHNIGLRGDVRYFRSLQKDESNTLDLALGSFKFWRGTVGVTFKF
jgi:opacity protein-like surface antigen